MLLLEQVIDVLDILKRVIYEPLQLGDNLQLVAYACTEELTYVPALLLDGIEYCCATLEGEDADI